MCVCDPAVFVGGRNKFVGGHECSMHCLHILYTRAVFYHVLPKFKRGIPSVSFVTTPVRVYMLRIYSAVILVLAINSLKIKQMVDFFVLRKSSGCVLN